MKPILFSVIEAQRGRIGWVRTGTDICYYKNCYRRKGRQRNYLTTSFTVNFPYAHDICYLAYHFPYTYSHLMASIWRWTKTVDQNRIYFRADSLCDSINVNEIPLLTITAPESSSNPINVSFEKFCAVKSRSILHHCAISLAWCFQDSSKLFSCWIFEHTFSGFCISILSQFIFSLLSTKILLLRC